LIEKAGGRAGAEAGRWRRWWPNPRRILRGGDWGWGVGPAFSGKKRVSLRSCTTTGLLPRSTANAAAAVGGCGFVLCGAARQSKAGRQGDHGVTDTDKPIANTTRWPTQYANRRVAGRLLLRGQAGGIVGRFCLDPIRGLLSPQEQASSRFGDTVCK
jgi:hypothetical protein